MRLSESEHGLFHRARLTIPLKGSSGDTCPRVLAVRIWDVTVSMRDRSALFLGIEQTEDTAHGFESWDRHTGLFGLSQGLEEKSLEFQRLTALEINEGRGFVSAHGQGALDLFVRQGIVEVKTQGPGGGNDFENEFANEAGPRWPVMHRKAPC